MGKIARFKGTRFSMPLINIIRGQKFAATAKREPFILVFRALRESEHMPEGTYQCEFEGGPTYSIYVMPTHTPEPEWQDYQAVFN